MHWFHVNYIACKIDGYVRFVTAMRLGLPSHYCSHSIKSQSDYWLAKEYFGQLIARDNFGVTRLQSNQLFNFLSQFAAQTFEDVLKPCKVPRIVNATMTRTRLEGDSDKGTGNETDGPVEPYHQLPHGSRINVRSCVQWHTRRALQMAANWVSVSIILVFAHRSSARRLASTKWWALASYGASTDYGIRRRPAASPPPSITISRVSCQKVFVRTE